MVTNKVNKEVKKKSKEKDSDLVDRKISNRNYVTIGIIFLITILAIFGLRHWYISYQKYQLTIPILKEKLKEVTVLELDNYINENSNALIYIEVSDDENSRKVAKGLLDVIKKENITEEIVYMNLSSVEDKDKFFKEFNEKYALDEKITNYPAFVLFNEGKLEAFVSKTKKQNLNIADIVQLLESYELVGNE